LYDLEIDELKAELEVIVSHLEDLKKKELEKGLTDQDIDLEIKCRFWYMEIKQKLNRKGISI
jgi:hypothetical protein